MRHSNIFLWCAVVIIAVCYRKIEAGQFIISNESFQDMQVECILPLMSQYNTHRKPISFSLCVKSGQSRETFRLQYVRIKIGEFAARELIDVWQQPLIVITQKNPTEVIINRKLILSLKPLS